MRSRASLRRSRDFGPWGLRIGAGSVQGSLLIGKSGSRVSDPGVPRGYRGVVFVLTPCQSVNLSHKSLFSVMFHIGRRKRVASSVGFRGSLLQAMANTGKQQGDARQKHRAESPSYIPSHPNPHNSF